VRQAKKIILDFVGKGTNWRSSTHDARRWRCRPPGRVLRKRRPRPDSSACPTCHTGPCLSESLVALWGPEAGSWQTGCQTSRRRLAQPCSRGSVSVFWKDKNMGDVVRMRKHHAFNWYSSTILCEGEWWASRSGYFIEEHNILILLIEAGIPQSV
jgi:hypothetical protein